MGYLSISHQFRDAGGYNYTEVAAVCANPAQPRPWDAYNPLGTTVVEWPAEGVLNWCDVCVFFDGDGVSDIDGYSAIEQIYSNVAMMGKTDWLAFGLTGTVVGLTTAREARDIMVCDLQNADIENKAWQSVLTLQSSVRRYLFIPSLLACISALVIYQGGDALTVCFNAVALLFLADIDNYTYGFEITDDLRMRLETEGRTRMGELDANAAANSQIMHVVSVVLSLFAGVMLRTRMSTEDAGVSQAAYNAWFAHAVLGLSMPWWGLMFARIVEVMSADADISTSSKMKSIASVVGASLVGFLAFFVTGLSMTQT